MLRAVTLDFWGTLADAQHSLREERVDTLFHYLGGLPREQIAQAYDAGWTQFMRGLELGVGLGAPLALSTTLDTLGVSLQPPAYTATLHHWEQVILQKPPRFLDGVPDVLRELRRRHLAVALISDTGYSPGRVMRQVLAQAGLLALFDWLTFSDEVGVTKRRPQAFTSTLRALGVAPKHALHVGDTPETDIDGAHAVGMSAALVLESLNRRDGASRADIVLEHIADLPAALDRWAAEH